jgi:plasmid stabilization system protein ParE
VDYTLRYTKKALNDLDEIIGRNVRKLVHSPILIYYRINEEKHLAEVLHLRHGARRPPRSEIS